MSDDRGKMVKPKAGQTMCGGYSTGSGGAQKLDTLIALLNRPYGNLTAGERKDAADEITALRARLEAVEKELVEMTAAKEIHQTRRAEYFARAERAEAALATARRDAEPYIIKIGPDHGVCVGGRWDGWLFHKHADGHWVSQQKLASESLSSALAAPACLHLTAEMAAACRTCNPHQMPALAVTREDARIPDHAAWAARGRWREAYEALRALTDEVNP